jgi:hypothetical protein
MLAGEWYETHQGIAFYEDGTLADGQHRLRAIVQSGVSLWMRVTWGMTRRQGLGVDETFTRTARQQLEILNGAIIPHRAADVARQMPSILGKDSVTRRLSARELEHELHLYADGIAMTLRAMPSRKKGITTSAVRAAFSYAYPASPAAVEQIAADFAEGTCEPGSVMMKARDKIAGHGGRYDGLREKRLMFVYILRAISAAIDGRKKLDAEDRAMERFSQYYDGGK